MQRERRRDPYPWTWEVPLTATLVTLLALIFGIQLARTVANLIAGAGWTWPDSTAGTFPSPVGTAFWTSLPHVLAGSAEAGLPTPSPEGLAGPGLLWGSLAVIEVALLTAAISAGVWASQRWGPGRMRGMATAAEAEQLLGVSRLRKVAGIVRPDLYGKQTTETDMVQRTAGEAPEQPGPQLGYGLSPWLLTGRRTRDNR